MTKLHPLNSGFVWRAAAAPHTILNATQVTQYDRDGYFLFERALTPGEVEAVIAAIDPFEVEGERWLKTQPGGQFMIAKADAITFTVHLVAKSAALAAFSRHKVLSQIAHDTLGPKPRLYWDQAVYKKPGNPEEFPWHQDNGYTYVEPQQYLTCWIALTDATVENGCPWVVPGLHRHGTLAHEPTPLGWQCLREPKDAIPVEAKAGDIVVFSSLTPHRTGPNLTQTTRKAYILQYAPDGAHAFPGGTGDPVPQNDAMRQYLV
jgi:ectoine hydroxylase-related dioxygenase (phytanoyl-CoA dioxygenase family)